MLDKNKFLVLLLKYFIFYMIITNMALLFMSIVIYEEPLNKYYSHFIVAVIASLIGTLAQALKNKPKKS